MHLIKGTRPKLTLVSRETHRQLQPSMNERYRRAKLSVVCPKQSNVLLEQTFARVFRASASEIDFTQAPSTLGPKVIQVDFVRRERC